MSNPDNRTVWGPTWFFPSSHSLSFGFVITTAIEKGSKHLKLIVDWGDVMNLMFRNCSVWVAFRYIRSLTEPSGLRTIIVSRKGMQPCSFSCANYMLSVVSVTLRCVIIFFSWSLRNISKTSSTYLFQSLGLQCIGAVAMARCSKNSI